MTVCSKIWLLIVAFLLSSVAAQVDATSATAETEVDLYSLSDAELEEICTVRGFELVHDNETTVFTHDDYVEAARQCLAIEQDMEEIIQEHPEILSELEQERDRMMAEKERLEKELLEEAEKRADGRQPDLTQHAAFVSHTEGPEEIVDLDKEDNEFDLIGHQEPLSDTRVHEETLDSSSQETPASDETSVPSTRENDDNPLSLRATFREFKERITRDFNAVANVVFPKAMRGPTKEALLKAGRIAKREAINVYKFLMRYVKAFIEKRKNRTENEGESSESTVDEPQETSS